MKKIASILCIIIMISSVVTGAPKKRPEDAFKKGFAKVTSLLYDENYLDALPILLSLDTMYLNNANIKFQIGLCYLKNHIDFEKSIPFLEDAVANVTADYREGYYKEDRAPLDAIQFLADAYHLNYEFEKAMVTYASYRSKFTLDEVELFAELDKKIAMCRYASDLVKVPINMSVTNLGGLVNSPYSDYSPVLTVDESTLIFTSRREGSTGGQLTAQGKYYEDIYISENFNGKWTAPRSIGPMINSYDHEATKGLAADGSKLYIYKYKDGSGDIFVSRLMGAQWMEPVKLGADVNTPSFEPSAAVSADDQLLVFTSDRDGGFGGLDLWYSVKMPTGDWSKARNMGPIVNTENDEDSPFLHADGKTLFFSSNGHETMGGFDIVFSEKDDEGNWGLVQNMGYPVNTTGDDLSYHEAASGTRAYYSSFRKDGFGEQDIYMINFLAKKEKPLTVYRGIIKNSKGDVPEIFITVFDNETGEEIGRYIPNSATGKYTIVLAPGKSYNISYEGDGCFFKSQIIDVPENSAYQLIKEAIELDELQVGSSMALENIFFDYGKATLRPASMAELDNVYALIKGCAEFNYEIGGHTDSHGDDGYNMKLSQSRCQSVVDYLVNKGIEKSKLTAVGYGETKPVAPNENEDGSDNEEGRAKNRRIELNVVAR